jgi:phospholipase/carboxylesterase
LALYTLLKHNLPLGGLVILSAYLPFSSSDFASCPSQLSKHVLSTPIFWGHGDIDPVIPFQWGKLSVDRLVKFGFPVTFTPYQHMAHSTSVSERLEVAEFIRSTLNL